MDILVRIDVRRDPEQALRALVDPPGAELDLRPQPIFRPGSRCSRRPPPLGLTVVLHLGVERLRVDPEVADDERLEQVPERVRVLEQPGDPGLEGGGGQRGICDMASGCLAQLAAASKRWLPGWQVLDDEDAREAPGPLPPRDEVITEGAQDDLGRLSEFAATTSAAISTGGSSGSREPRVVPCGERRYARTRIQRGEDDGIDASARDGIGHGCGRGCHRTGSHGPNGRER